MMQDVDAERRVADLAALAQAYKETFATEPGQRVLAHLATFCNEKRTTYQVGDAHHTAFREGARTVILEIRKKLEASAEPMPARALNEESADD